MASIHVPSGFDLGRKDVIVEVVNLNTADCSWGTQSELFQKRIAPSALFEKLKAWSLRAW